MDSGLLRVEGVNLSTILDDTDDISVYRGASMLLRKAVKDVSIEFSDVLEVISVGASIGLYSFNDVSGNELVEKVTAYLNRHKEYRYFTFVIEYELLNTKDEFKWVLESLIARSRFRQQEALSVATPITSNTTQCCEFDKLRPSDDRGGVKGKTNMSSSARARFEFGRKQRYAFYRDELELADDYDLLFCDDLSTLSSNPQYGNLDGKMAVIYFDGNGFGSIQSNCNSKKNLERWDTKIQTLRKDYLSQLIRESKNDSEFQSDGACRIETLLWGGDELMLVVPAWKGMSVIQDFYKISKDWKHEGKRLTHAGGIVFCNNKTPISRIRSLAKDLADGIKEKGQKYKQDNYFDYLVLESIDYPTESIENFYNKHYNSTDGREPLAAVDDWHSISTRFKSVFDEFSRSQLQKVGNAFISQDKSAYEIALDRMQAVMAENFSTAESIRNQLFPGQNSGWGWIHLMELWDYVSPVSSNQGETA